MFSGIKVQSPNIRYAQNYIESDYIYESVNCRIENNIINATPMKSKITFRTSTILPKLGIMLIGWAGNNGSTLTASILANKKGINWRNKNGELSANYFGSITQCSTVYIGKDENEQNIYLRMADILPMVDPNNFVIDGFDIVDMNIGDAMRNSKVLDINLQDQLYDELSKFKPRKAIFNSDFIASNQKSKANNYIKNENKLQQVEIIRQNIRDFKLKNNLDKVILLWTGNTERFMSIKKGVHDTADNLIKAIKNNESELSPSLLYAVASIQEGVTYINGSPQNTFVNGLIELAEKNNVFISGSDFKSGQTKFKSVLVDFLTSAGIKPRSIVSYNHLGNNDGLNLSESKQFESKEISKLSVVDDAVKSNPILFKKNENVDHIVVIKYVPFVGDSKKAIDEYSSELMMGGLNTVVIHNTCEDSLLATPLIIDLVLLAELCERVKFKVHTDKLNDDFQSFNSVLSLLSYLLKCPLVERNANIVNSLFKQRYCIENTLRALISLPPINFMDFKYKLSDESKWFEKETEPINLILNGI